MRTLRTLLLWISCLFVLAAGCRKGDNDTPVETVKQFHQLAEQGQWEQALLLVDLDAKCTEMLGDLYRQGAPADQASMRDIWSRRLQESTATYRSKHFGDTLGSLRLLEERNGSARVEQKNGKFLLIYSLAKGPEGWRIVDRVHELDGVRPDPARSLEVILQHIEKDLGRKPTLADVNARLEDYMKRLKIRRIQVR